ncbi:PQQ-dependent sugar dehydrogenase [Myxococcota bacterium]|nr:PQQ-dependent sugar dehydrogenase [Myxococcota bacterium]
MEKWRYGALSALVGLSLGACSLLPERYAVNAPLGNLVFGSGISAPSPSEWESQIRVPDGFQVSLYATGVRNARFLHFTAAGDLLVSQPRLGQVLLLERDRNGDGLPESRRILVQGLRRAQGLDSANGWLFVAEEDAVLRLPFDADSGEITGAGQKVVTGLPTGGNHWAKTLRAGPDGWIYLTVGSSCNVCEEDDPRRAAMLRFRPDGERLEIYASGLRNAEGFDWRPETGELYATDNGRDLLGDDFPPCELNRIRRGGFYGWPYANGNNRPDPDLGPGHEDRIRDAIEPVHGFRAHNAPLGIAFARTPNPLPRDYSNAAFVALHGSWNRTEKDGYKVVSLHWPEQAGESIEERDFLWGFEVDERVIGRPVDVAQGPDGALYISDDYAGSIYRVARESEDRPKARKIAPEATQPKAPLAGLDPNVRRILSEEGARSYATLGCAGCHDPAKAKPGVTAVPLDGLASRYRLGQLERFLETPTPPMPPVELEPEARRALAIHLLETHGQ